MNTFLSSSKVFIAFLILTCVSFVFFGTFSLILKVPPIDKRSSSLDAFSSWETSGKFVRDESKLLGQQFYPRRYTKFYKIIDCTRTPAETLKVIMDKAGMSQSTWNHFDVALFCLDQEKAEPMFSKLGPGQVMNLFPNSRKAIRDKAVFCSTIKRYWGPERMQEFTFPCFSLPQEWEDLQLARQTQPGDIWVAKVKESSLGKGVQIQEGKDVQNLDSVVQKYLSKPALIEGKKFDMRIYALVTSVSPLRVYIHGYSYMQISSKKYSISAESLKDKSVHVTNPSYQRHSRGFDFPKSTEDDIHGNTKSLKFLLDLVEKKHGSKAATKLWWRIKRSVVQALMSFRDNIKEPNCPGCFHIFGVDLILDSSLKNAYCIEININPGKGREAANASGVVLTDAFIAAFKMKGVHPQTWRPSSGELKHTVEQMGLQGYNGKTDEAKLLALADMLEEFYYREGFDIAWPSLHGEDTDLYDHFNNEENKLYHDFKELIKYPGLSILFAPQRLSQFKS